MKAGDRNYKKVSESQTVITELMTPNYANFGGKIHGGHILSLLDKVAYVCASKHADNYCVTVSVDTVDFHHPVEVGELLHLKASVNYVGRSSLLIGVKVISENFKTKAVRHTNSCYLTMVAMGDNGKPVQVPGLLLEDELSLRRFVEGKFRKKTKMEFAEEFKNRRKLWKSHLDEMDMAQENCELSLEM